MTPLRVLVVSDGRPGHVNQAQGLVRLLGERFETTAERLEAPLRLAALSRRALAPVVNREGPKSRSLAAYRLFHRGGLPRARPDVVVSAGGNTTFANVLLARRYRAPNVFLGSKRRVAGRCFAAHLTLEPTGEPSNIVMNVAPSPRSAAEIACDGRRFRARHGFADERLWLMACGGDGAGKRYQARHWRALGAWMNDIAERHAVRWLVSTSRRTGARGEEALRAALAARHLAYAVWWNERPAPILGDLMGAAQTLFVTVDSMSMISEAIGAGKPVVQVCAGAGRLDARYRAALAKYERLGVSRNADVADPYRRGEFAPPPLASLFAAQLDELEARIRAAMAGKPCDS